MMDFEPLRFCRFSERAVESSLGTAEGPSHTRHDFLGARSTAREGFVKNQAKTPYRSFLLPSRKKHHTVLSCSSEKKHVKYVMWCFYQLSK